MQYLAYLRPWSDICNLDNFSAVYLKHGDRQRVANDLIYHGMILAQAVWALFRPAGTYSVCGSDVHKLPDMLFSDAVHDTAHGRVSNLLGVGKEHVPPHQLRYNFNCFLRERKTRQSLGGYFRSDHVMTVKRPILFFFRPASCRGLSNVMEKCGKASLKVKTFFLRMSYSPHSVFKDIKGMSLVLVNAKSRFHLRNH